MRQRCSNPNMKAHKNYGGRGITVCSEWVENFGQFCADMGPRPSKDHSIERRDNSKGYSPENCYWATKSDQNNNKRNNRILNYRGASIPLKRAMAVAGCTVTHAAVILRIKNGWAVEAALETPRTRGHGGRPPQDTTGEVP